MIKILALPKHINMTEAYLWAAHWDSARVGSVCDRTARAEASVGT